MKPLSILHTESSLGWGGQEIRILSEAQGFIARGHHVRLICPQEARIFTEAPNWGVPAVGLPIAKKRLVGLKCMFEWLKGDRPHVVNTHSSTDAWLVAIALLALGRPAPMVRTRHISAKVPRNAPTRWLYTRATRRIVTTGENLRQELIRRNGFPEKMIDSVPTGIDTHRFLPGDKAAARAAVKLPHDKTLVGIVATLRSWKGHRYLVEAIAGLPENVGLVIVGDGPQRDALEVLVDKHHLRHRVWFANNQRDVLPWLQSLDIFALPSYANEGVPQALVQAMLTALPCVTTTAGAIGEVARHEKTALVVPAQDVQALRSAIERLMSDPDLGRTLGAEARAHCAANYSYEHMLDRMEAIFRQVSGRY